MRKYLFVPAVLGAALFATSAFAAAKNEVTENQPSHMTGAGQCTYFTGMLDQALRDNPHATNASSAKAMLSQGSQLCVAGNHDNGVAKLRQGLQDMGVTIPD